MDPIVGAVKGHDKHESLDILLEMTEFNSTLSEAYKKSKRPKQDFRVVIKPNMMVFVTHEAEQAVVTDPKLVEHLVDHIIELGFTHITLCEAQHDVGRMFKNHNVQFVSEQIGYKPDGRYWIADLTLEKETFHYRYVGKNGGEKTWKDTVGRTWRDADFRISFAKCKTHEHDYMTLAVEIFTVVFRIPQKSAGITSSMRWRMSRPGLCATSRFILRLWMHGSHRMDFRDTRSAIPSRFKCCSAGRMPLLWIWRFSSARAWTGRNLRF